MANKRKMRNVDSADVGVRVFAFAWALAGGLAGGLMMVLADVWAGKANAAASFAAGVSTEVGVKGFSHPGLMILAGFVGGFLFTYFVSVALTQKYAETIGGIYAPSGGGTPPVREYSRARALAMQGDYEKASAAWELNVVEYPEDPVPYMELGRLYRNEINDYEEAVKWYRRGKEESQMSSGQLLLATQEIIEIYTHKLNQPRKAIPHLADFVSRFPDDPNAERARKQLQELREQMRAEDGL